MITAPVLGFIIGYAFLFIPVVLLFLILVALLKKL